MIGKNTVEALQSGILYGFAGQIDGVVNRMADELADDPNDVTVVATGGLAPLVLEEAEVDRRARALAHADRAAPGLRAQHQHDLSA